MEWVGRVGWEEGRRGSRDIMISTHYVGGSWEKQYSTQKTSSDSIASYYADGQRLQWAVGWGESILWVIVVTTTLLM